MICEELHSEGGLQESFAFRELLSRFEPNELYGTEKYYPVTESYSVTTRNVNDTLDWLNIFMSNDNWIKS